MEEQYYIDSTVKLDTRTSEIKVDIKPLSVNEAWQGQRFKTPAYKEYEKHLLLLLPRLVMPTGKLKIILEFGMSNIMSDWDNPVKPFVDILQKKYSFNDANIWEAEVRKVKVEKLSEYISFEIISINNKQSNKLPNRPMLGIKTR